MNEQNEVTVQIQTGQTVTVQVGDRIRTSRWFGFPFWTTVTGIVQESDGRATFFCQKDPSRREMRWVSSIDVTAVEAA